MPKIDDQHKLPNDNFGYSAIRLDKLGATEYTLVGIVCDQSGSVGTFKTELEACLTEILSSCKYSPRADNLMIRLISFPDKGNDNGGVNEVHGFKLLNDITPNQYNGALTPNGMTPLYDATLNGIKALADFAKHLTESDYAVNAIVVVITDGDDNQSANGPATVKKALLDAVRNETMESLVSILVAVNTQQADLKIKLDDFHKDVGFTQFVAIDQANSKSLAKLAQFVSKSISAQSQALGSKGASKPLSF